MAAASDEGIANPETIDGVNYQDELDEIMPEELAWNANEVHFKPHANAKREAYSAERFLLPNLYNYLRYIERDVQKAKKGFNPQTSKINLERKDKFLLNLIVF